MGVHWNGGSQEMRLEHSNSYNSPTMVERRRIISSVLGSSFLVLQEKKTYKLLGCCKKGRLISSWDGYLPGFRICRNFLIREENVVRVHGSS